MEKNKLGRGGILVIIAVAVILVFVGFLYFFLPESPKPRPLVFKPLPKKSKPQVMVSEPIVSTQTTQSGGPAITVATPTMAPPPPEPTAPAASAVAPAVPEPPTAPEPATPGIAQAATPAPPVKVVAAKEVPEALKLAIVQKGEGIEHVLIRQLIFVPELYGFKGDTGDKKAVKKWAQTKAHQIAILAGYVDAKTGNEVRVKGQGGDVAYVLQTDSGLKLSVAQYCKGKDGNFPEPGSKTLKTLELAKDFQSATFQGNIDVQSYEYLYFKVKEK